LQGFSIVTIITRNEGVRGSNARVGFNRFAGIFVPRRREVGVFSSSSTNTWGEHRARMIAFSIGTQRPRASS
jgi:hypothetical protein